MARGRRRQPETSLNEALDPGLERDHERFGWSLLLVALVAGTTLEGLLGFKVAGLLLDPIRRELWSLAHFHAGLLALVNLVYAPRAPRPGERAALASRALLSGSLLLPLGFFLGGLAHPEGDPGLGILLVPLGALLLILPIALQARAAWRG